ncbi:hypothetical protein KKF84_07395 [Myxococcota bacterium]|nr:hypothetical protein [Myxococcota bacterium]MBU1535128.1 hypothetical protein [Myxococcota bacterium]
MAKIPVVFALAAKTRPVPGEPDAALLTHPLFIHPAVETIKGRSPTNSGTPTSPDRKNNRSRQRWSAG